MTARGARRGGGAFAGTAVRVEFGGRARGPAARLQLGTRSVAGDGRAFAPAGPVPAFELGIGGREGGSLFVAGRSAAEIERSLGLSSRTGTAATVAGAVALLVVGVLVISNLDRLDDGYE